ncbi:MAG TPA: Spy/CpxP family protein refolding chaperone [Nevskiaceae bacterium]|nr:Spy/CpxP family protein refolding chaperone [Nevskiaceae bacterium]
MHKMFKTLLIPAAIAVSLAGGAALAQPFGGGHHQMMVAALDQLDLSDSQWLQIHKIMQAQREERHAQDHHALMAAFESLNPDSPDYAAQVQAAQDQAAAAAREHVAHAADVKKQIYAVLTPEQKSKLATLKAAHQHGAGG